MQYTLSSISISSSPCTNSKHDSMLLFQEHPSNNKFDPYYTSANNPFINGHRCHPRIDYSYWLRLYLTDLRLIMKFYKPLYTILDSIIFLQVFFRNGNGRTIRTTTIKLWNLAHDKVLID